MTASQETTTNPYATLTLVREHDGYIIGNLHSAEFVAVPDIGGRIMEWLQAGRTAAECAELACESMGEWVDVDAFLAGLQEAGVLAPGGTAVPSARPARGRVIGRMAFGVPGLAVQGVLALAGVALLVLKPELRPTYRDAFPVPSPLVSLLIVTFVGSLFTFLHELAHYLAAARQGVSSSMSISRRLFFVVAQTDLTRMWSIPRRKRAVPLVAGILFDAAVVGLALIHQAWFAAGTSVFVTSLVRAAVLINLGAIITQAAMFMRTDLYALFVVATGCKNLWAIKGALARSLIRRATDADRAALAASDAREILWGRVFLALYVPGIALATWYFAYFSLPAIARTLGLSVAAVRDDGPFSLNGLAGVTAMAFTGVTLGFVFLGLARTAWRVVRQLSRGLVALERLNHQREPAGVGEQSEGDLRPGP
jgi:putative peptide zinc metalloprotease protein